MLNVNHADIHIVIPCAKLEEVAKDGINIGVENFVLIPYFILRKYGDIWG